MALSTDFKDDILNESVNTKRKYNVIHNDDGTESYEDVTSYSQTGSQYGAKEVIEEREAINQLQDDVDALNSALANVMMRRGLLDASSAVEHLEMGIYEVRSDLPDWISFGWAIVFLPTKGSLNGAYAVSYASGTDAGMYYYSNRTSGWVHIA